MYKLKKIILLSLIFCFLTAILGLIVLRASITNQNAQIQTGDQLAITSAPQQSYQYSYSEKTTFGLGSLIGGNLGDFDFKDGRLSLSLATGEYSKENSRTDTTTQNPTNIKTQQNIALNSDKNIEISGSNINAGQDITISAKQNIDIIPTTETEKTKTKTEKGEVELSLGVTHETTDIYYAAKNLNNSTRQLKQAKEDYEAYEKALSQAEQDYANKIIDKQDLEDLKEDKKYYQANIALLTASLAAATKETTQTIAAAGSSASTFGFNFDIQLDIDALQEQSSLLMYLCRPSYLTANKNITIASGKNTHIIGSQVIAGKNLNITAKNTDITAGEEKSEKSYDSKHIHTIVSYALHGGLGGSASANSAKNITKTTNYINARLEASDIKIKSSANTNIKGAELTAAKDITLETGNDLTVESLQDTYKQKSLSLGASVGYSRGSKPENSKATNPQANAGVNFSATNGKSEWVSEQTQIIGSGAVNVKVGNKTELKGATIASASDKLTFDTGSFEYSDIRDKKTDSTIGAGLNWSKEYGTKPNGDSYASEYDAYAQYGFANKSQLNRAVIGAGNIIIRNNPNQDISDLKRDSTYARIQTKNTGVNLRLDTDTLGVVLNPIDTVKEIKEDSAIIYSLGEGVGKSIYQGVINNLGLFGTLKAIDNSVKDTHNIVDMSYNQFLAEIINNAVINDALSLEDVVNQAYFLVQASDGVLEPSKIILYQGDSVNNKLSWYAAGYNQQTNETFLNTQGTDISNGGDIINSIFVEAQRKNNYDLNIELNYEQQTDLSYFRGEQAEVLWNRFSSPNPSIISNELSLSDWNKANSASNIILYGNNIVNNLDTNYILPRVTVYSRPLQIGDIGRHLFIVVEKKGDNKTKRIISLDSPRDMQGIIFGGIPTIYTIDGSKNDEIALNSKGITQEKQIIDVPQGMTETEFDELVINNAEKFNAEYYLNKYPPLGGAGQILVRNSNTFVDNVIEESGGTIKDFDKAFHQNAFEGVERIYTLILKGLGLDEETIKEIIREKRGFND